MMKNFVIKTAMMIALGCAVSTQVQAQPAEGRYTKEIPYRVINVAYNDVLNMRNGPGKKHYIVGYLQPQQSGIFIRYCSRYINWCQVQAGNQVGWVNMRYLAGYAY